MSFSGKTVLVTGATGLIGSELVDAFREAGAEVLSAVRDPARAKGKKRALRRPRCP